MRRAAQWDGAVPLFESARHGQAPSPEQVRDLADYLGRHRGERREQPFDIVVGGVSDPSSAPGLIRALRDAGATWWDERQLQTTPDLYRADSVLRRIEAGPPAID